MNSAKPEASKDSLDRNSILIAEFEYIAQTAFQANEDRSRVSTFYIVSVASFIAAMFTTLDNSGQSVTPNPNLQWAFVFLFLGLAAYGVLTVVQIAGLRLAWFASARAMNAIKDHYLSAEHSAEFDKAFVWRLGTLPPVFKWTSVTVLSAMQVALLSALMFGAAVAYWRLLYQGEWLGWAVGAGLGLLAVQVIILAAMLRRSR